MYVCMHVRMYVCMYVYIYTYNFKFLVWNGFQRALNFLGAVLNYSKRFQGSKVFHRFNALNRWNTDFIEDKKENLELIELADVTFSI